MSRRIEIRSKLPLTHVARKWPFLLAICIKGCEQVVKGRTTIATCGRGHVLAIFFLLNYTNLHFRNDLPYK